MKPLFLLIAYVGLIPAFAWLYNQWPYEFYHSTNKYEKYLKKDFQEIKNMIQKEIRLNLFKTTPDGRLHFIGGYFDTSSLRVESLNIDEPFINYDVYGSIIRSGLGVVPYRAHIRISEDFLPSLDTLVDGQLGRFFYFSAIPLTLKFDSILPKFLSHSRGFNGGDSPPIYDNNEDGTDGKMDSLQYSKKDPSTTPVIGFCFFSAKILNAITAYRSSLLGFPSYSSGNYGRMLYLSAMVITTVGPGDILPISERARTAITIEAVLGIIIIGLFLSSLADRIVYKRNEGNEQQEDG